MRIGIGTPIVTRIPGAHDDWEREAGIRELVDIARTADRFGFDHLTCSEHVAVPEAAAEHRGDTYWDPLATFGHLSAVTNRIRLVTQVLVLGYHHPLAIAKRYGTLDQVSGGRLVLGVGVGSLREEFDLLGANFPDRGPRADDALDALRTALSDPRPHHSGPFYEFDGMVVQPHAVQQHVPIWVGGRSSRSLRRAVRAADGWVPFGLSRSELTRMLAAIDIPPGFDIALSAPDRLDPLDHPGDAGHALERLRDLGATTTGVRLVATDPQHYRQQLAALRELALARGFDLDEQEER